MKLLITILTIFSVFILIIFFYRRHTVTKPGNVDSLERTITTETRVTKLELDSIWQARQIRALTVNDSLQTLRINSLSDKLSFLITRYQSDSNYQWNAIKIEAKASSLTVRFTSDSAKQWAQIKPAYALIPQVASLKKDSITQWAAITRLQGVSPVTQIPLMQSQMSA